MQLGEFGWNEADALGSLLGGAFTTATFGATLTLLVREIRTRRAESRERDRERQDNERRQARLVYATLNPDVPIPSDHLPTSMQGPRDQVHVRVYNHSDEPVWDVKVIIPDRSRPLLVETVPPHDSRATAWMEAPDDWHLMHVGPGCPGTPTWTSLDVVFVDNRGLRWRRSGRAEPVRLFDNQDIQTD
ncbi:hypothetical protein ACSNN9_18190 [Micromonospora sp. URMC 107]|uniref:hypothetical protein n=1 Tax=Micromonospora sp. URMC 107 TaxID=3423418 RepID=UPI003F1CDDE4